MLQKTSSLYGLPEKVTFCKKCVMSNQRPCSSIEFKTTKKQLKKTMNLDENGICDACNFNEQKKAINWKQRESELLQLLDKHRSNNGDYDCIVSGSGGKDSVYTSHMLKYKYGMNPLTVTFPPILYTDYGYKNFRNWIEIGGFDNITLKPNGRVQKLLTKLSIENLLHPFQTFILGQKNIAPKIAIKFGIPLIFYGENEAEYGNPIADNSTSLRDKSFYTFNNINDVRLAGVTIKELIEKYDVKQGDLKTYLPADHNELTQNKIDVRYFGYYAKWIPQEAYYYSVEHAGFQARPYRSEGTYSKYSSIDDKIDDLHYYTTYIKFGLGRASYDASQEIRNNHITREEGIALVNRFDGEIPQKYTQEVLDYLDINVDHFFELCDKSRSPHLWEKKNGKWNLKHKVSNENIISSDNNSLGCSI